MFLFRFGNLETCFVPQPDVVARFSRDANAVNNLNHLRQSILALEKVWVTQDGNFWIDTGLMAKTEVDVYQLSYHHGLVVTDGKHMSIVLSFSLIYLLF